MKSLSIFAAAAATVLSVAAADAAVLDFNGLPSGTQGSSSVDLGNAEITSTDDLFIYREGAFGDPFGVNGGFCALNTSVFECTADATITFTQNAVYGLTFDAINFDSGDSVVASIFSGTDLLSSISLSANQTVDFSAFAGVTSLSFVDQGSSGAGLSYTNFEFTEVPLPAGLVLLLTSLGAFGVMRRKS
uniref:PEP-CTERM protein-sorting domain-containing protein n=1 Tax=Haptolina ericina TaxID=156174 RepID=A0A7S3B149_9EUKA|mmetsp:Transcript_45215/g.102087  ORF Transcript_45215/g.102087 Transcript_45215/m.102087 type:complete len:189 (+) Transcript_45215:86-652(+)